jgi:hypothetical protein
MSNNLKAIYWNTLLPRIVFIPFLVTNLLLRLLRLGQILLPKRKPRQSLSSLCIEAGIVGWRSIEFKELYPSACEYLDVDRVHKVEIDREQAYLPQVKQALNRLQPTHYMYDPRTGSENWLRGLWQAFQISFLLASRHITPVVLLTDLAVRTWRVQSAVVTATSGVVVTFMAPSRIQPIFPHRRLVGPSLMPFSQATLAWLDHLPRTQPDNNLPRAIFTGSLYEPRTSILNAIKVGLEARGLTLDIQGRPLGSPRVSDEEYWLRLANADIVVTTSDQSIESGKDWLWIPHLLYRYLEVVACGTLLVAPEVPGIGRFFTPGEHFVSFKKPEDAIDAIEYYLNHPVERGKIAKQGYARARALIESRIFWLTMDVALGHESLS